MGSVGLAAQSIGATGPEINALSVAPVVTGFAGPLAPFAYLCATLIGVAFGSVIKRFATSIAAAGGTYRFIRAGLGGPAGVFGGATYFFGMFVFVPFTAVLSATVFSEAGSAIFPHSHWFASGHWFEITLVELCVVALLCHLGVRPSVGLLIGLSTFGMTALLIFDIAILVQGGAHGLSFSALMPWNVHGIPFSSFAVSLGLAMGGFFCSETPAFLAEETREPRKTVPRAIMLSIVVMMVFLVIHSYAVIVGLGVGNSGEFAKQGAAIVLTLSPRYIASWYGDMLLVELALACFASVLALYNAAARLMYDWGREGTLSAQFGRVHIRHHTPTVAIGAIGVASLVVSVAGLVWQGDSLAGGDTLWGWALLAGVMLILAGYVLVGLSAIALQLKARTRVAPAWRHYGWYLAPTLVVVGMLLSMFSQIHPFPPPPFSSAPIAALIILGLAAAMAVHWQIRHRGAGVPSGRGVSEEPVEEPEIGAVRAPADM